MASSQKQSSDIQLPGLSYLQTTRDLITERFLRVLDSIPGDKSLFLDSGLISPVIRLISSEKQLRIKQVASLHTLSTKPFDPTRVKSRNVIYILRPTKENLDDLNRVVLAIDSLGRRDVIFRHEVYLVPRKTVLAEKQLSETILGSIRLSELDLGLVPLDDDILTLAHLPNHFVDFAQGDISCIMDSVMALSTFGASFSLGDQVFFLGQNSEKLAYNLSSRFVEESSKSGRSSSFLVRKTIVVDRYIDMITVLKAPLSYEALLNECFGVRFTGLSVGSDIFKDTQTLKNVQRLHLDSRDEVFINLRDLNMGKVGSALKDISKDIESRYDRNTRGKSITALREMAGKLGEMKKAETQLAAHIALAEEIVRETKSGWLGRRIAAEMSLLDGVGTSEAFDLADEMLSMEYDLGSLLRLLSLVSLVEGGIKRSRLDAFRKDILDVYGFGASNTLFLLESTGILRQQGTKDWGVKDDESLQGISKRSSSSVPIINNWSSIRKAMKLMREPEEGVEHYSDLSSGYSPLIVSFLEVLLTRGPSTLSKTLSKLGLDRQVPFGSVSLASGGGEDDSSRTSLTGELKKKKHNWGWKGEEKEIGIMEGLGDMSGKRDAVLVYFLGGVTNTEISCLRKMKASFGGAEILVAGTGIVSGPKVIEDFIGQRFD